MNRWFRYSVESLAFFVHRIMDFLGVPCEDQIFTARLSPERMDISQPVCRVEMNLVLLTREIDPQDAETKKKIVMSKQVEKLNSSCRKVSTESLRETSSSKVSLDQRRQPRCRVVQQACPEHSSVKGDEDAG